MAATGGRGGPRRPRYEDEGSSREPRPRPLRRRPAAEPAAGTSGRRGRAEPALSRPPPSPSPSRRRSRVRRSLSRLVPRLAACPRAGQLAAVGVAYTRSGQAIRRSTRSGEHQPGDDHRQPDQGPRPARRCRAARPSASSASRSTTAARTRPTSGSTSPTTSTSSSSAPRARTARQYLKKGRPVAVDGRLRWSSWEDKNGGGKRSKVEIVANVVQFLGSRGDAGQGGGSSSPAGPAQGNQGFAPTSDVPADTSDFAASRPASAPVAAARTTTSRSRSTPGADPPLRVRSARTVWVLPDGKS